MLSDSPGTPHASPNVTPNVTRHTSPHVTPRVPSRRALLGTAMGGALGTAAVLGAPSAAEAATYRPARYRATPVLGASARHLVGRFSYGVTPSLAAQVRGAGGAPAWFERQLDPASIPDRSADARLSWWPSLSRAPLDLWTRTVTDVEGGWQVMHDYGRWVLLRRISSQRQVLEVMTELWENHFNVTVVGDRQFTHRKSYGDMIRGGALGKFADLLTAAVTHPAMLLYLDAHVSTAQHPNENLGRELLELHTVGRGTFTEDDVKASAKLLTGWSVDTRGDWSAQYVAANHHVGRVQVMGFTDPNADTDGREVTRRYLGYLARHPATAQRVARRLAVKFVRDDPPQSLVDQLARVYLANDTEIAPVLRALVSSTAFTGSRGLKVRDPGEDVVATWRALRVKVAPPRDGESAATQILWQTASLGAMPLTWPRPDGAPIDNDSWANPSRVMASMRVHYLMAGTWWPTQDIAYRTARAWVPELPIRFDLLVDHLSREILHRPSTARLLRACCEAVEARPGESVGANHPLLLWRMPRLLTTFLDSPDFLTR